MNNVLYEASYQMNIKIPLTVFLLAACLRILVQNIQAFRDAKQCNEKYEKHPHYPKKSLTGYIFGILIGIFGFSVATFFFTTLLISEFDMHKNIITAYQNEQYETVEGCVENFEPRDSDHFLERFTINGISFEYSGWPGIQGYNTPSYKNGVITGNGQHLKSDIFTTEMTGTEMSLYALKNCPNKSRKTEVFIASVFCCILVI